MNYCYYDTPVGKVTLAEDGGFLTALLFGEKPMDGDFRESEILSETAGQLGEYFSGARKSFSVPMKPHGTDFQKRVWAELERIPYGETRTYGGIASLIGNPKACRAVGMANHNNPIAIIVPCHRVVGSNGALTGYAGGLDIKSFLLELEQETLK